MAWSVGRAQTTAGNSCCICLPHSRPQVVGSRRYFRRRSHRKNSLKLWLQSSAESSQSALLLLPLRICPLKAAHRSRSTKSAVCELRNSRPHRPLIVLDLLEPYPWTPPVLWVRPGWSPNISRPDFIKKKTVQKLYRIQRNTNTFSNKHTIIFGTN